jgi:hypothetical protein
MHGQPGLICLLKSWWIVYAIRDAVLLGAAEACHALEVLLKLSLYGDKQIALHCVKVLTLSGILWRSAFCYSFMVVP